MKTTRLVIIIFVSFICLFGLTRFLIRSNSFKVRQQIISQDYSALLAGCRDLIGKRSVLKSDWPDDKSRSKDTILLDSKIKPFGDEVPKVIRDLKPVNIEIHEECVFINMGTVPINVIVGFIAGYSKNMDQREAVRLANGLWLFTNSREDQPETTLIPKSGPNGGNNK
jgi:hypothetical protein